MGRGFEEVVSICGRRYEAVAWDLSKMEARRETDQRVSEGFLARYRIYRPLGSAEARYVVYAARPRCGAPAVAVLEAVN